ncbi:hypothetical protein HII31_02593 [Pseudocercospora fuligena]|uniref:Uncharacterized protein n=1 Tax=Pseudocercospora fuligena TaxID=685502 RepID=A0A8H6RSR8_9PEZI|nr:hypothetical protein HII31_02593 [Pseudocercospora fuligena]
MSLRKSTYEPDLNALSTAESHLDTCAFTKIQDGTYLQGEAIREVYKFLAHCLAVRAMDLYKRKIRMDGTPYQRPLRKANLAFQDLLIKAENVPGLLPPDWDRNECITYCSAEGWLDGEESWPKGMDTIEEAWEYDDAISLKFRCLGEVIYGSAVDGEPLLDRMAALEAGLSKTGTPPSPNSQPSKARQTK